MHRIARITFQKQMPAHAGVFDYRIPENLQPKIQIGSAVMVSFRKQKTLGIVYGLQSHSHIPEAKLQTITELVHGKPLLSALQIKLLPWLEEHTGSSPATLTNIFIPKKPAKEKYPHATTDKVKKIITPPLPLTYLFEKTEDEIKIILKHAHTGTHLIILPDIASVNRLFSLLSKKLPRHILTITSELNPTERYRVWKSVFENSVDIVIGTRMGCFLPFTSLNNIFVCAEDDIAHTRVEQHPDFDTRKIAQHLSNISGAQLIYTTACPSTERWYQFEQKKETYINLTNPHLASLVPIHLKNLQTTSGSALSDEFITYLKSSKKKAFILLNKKIRYGFISCGDCHWQPLCSTCGRTLIESEKKDALICRLCLTTQPLSTSCPKCGGMHFKKGSPGIPIVMQQLQKQIPFAKILPITKELKPEPGEITKSDVIVGTFAALSKIPWENLGSVYIHSVASWFQYPDYRSTEWAIQRIRSLRARLPHDAKIFLPIWEDVPGIDALSNKNIFPFFKKELQMRKRLFFPPFAIIFTVTPDAQIPPERLQRMQQDIAKWALATHTDLRVGQLPHNKKSTNKTNRLIIRCERNKENEVLKFIHKNFQKNWVVEQNPLDL